MGAQNRGCKAESGGRRGGAWGGETSLALCAPMLCSKAGKNLCSGKVRGPHPPRPLGALVKNHKELGCFEFLAARLPTAEMVPHLKAHLFHKERGRTAEQPVWPPTWPWEGAALSAAPTLFRLL